MEIEWLLLLLVFVYSGLLKPGFHAATDFPYSSSGVVQSFFTLPHIWSLLTGPFGGNQIATLWSWPFGVITGFLSFIGFSHNLIVVFNVSLIIVLGCAGISKLGQLIGLSKEAKIVSAFFYLTNTYILLLIDGGQILWALAYAFFPLCIYQIEKRIQERKFLNLGDSLLIGLITFFDLRAAYLLGLILGIRFLYGLVVFQKKDYGWWIKFWVVFATRISLLLVGLHAYWLIPLYLSKGATLPADLVNNLNGDFQTFTTIKHSMLLYQPHWYQNIFGVVSSPEKVFLLIPFFVGIGVWVKRKNPLIIFLLIVAIVGVFFAKGPQMPLGQIFSFLFTHIPGFFVFRDPTKFFVFIALGYSLLIGSAVDFFLKSRSRKFSFTISLICIGFFVFLAAPVFLGWTSGLFSPNPFFNEYSNFEKIVDDLPPGKMLWVPGKTPSGFMDLNHLATNGLDLVNLRPFATGTKGTYETLNFLREASYSGQLLDVSGIGYLVYPPLDPRQSYKPDQLIYHQLFLSQLSGRNWVNKTETKEIPFLTTQTHQNLFFIPENTFLVVGPDDIYSESTKSADLVLSKNGLVFLEDKTGFAGLAHKQNTLLVLNRKTDLDLIVDLSKTASLIFPANFLTNSPDKSGWWKRQAGDFLWFKDFLVQKYGIYNQDFTFGGGWGVSEGNHQLGLPLHGQKGDILLVRALESTRSGILTGKTNSQSFSLDLKKEGDNMQWYQLGVLEQDSDQVTLQTNGDITIINAVATISSLEFNDLQNQVKTLHNQNRVVDFTTFPRSQSQPKVKFRKLNDDQYLVDVAGLKQPSSVVFAQSFDSNWRLNGQNAFPVYSIFNGFWIDKDGEYLVEYSPHQYLWIGEMISLATLIGLSGLLIWKKFSKH